MRRIAAILKKELLEHGMVLLALAILLSFVWAMLLLAVFAAPRTITLLESHAMFVRFFVPLTAIALGRRLVVREYHGRTQLFLEALPIRRAEVLAAKLGFGMLIVLVVALASLAMSATVAGLREPITLQWIALIAARTTIFSLAVYAYCFATGLLGRWRFGVHAAVFVGGLVLDSATAFEASDFAPIALVGERFVLEREVFPTTDALIVLGTFVGLIAASFALALVREGSIAESLGRRMSQRDKVAVGILVLGGIVVSAAAESSTEKEPFAFQGPNVVRSREAPLAVSYADPSHRRAAEELAAIVATDLAHLKRTLEMREIPRMHVGLRETLEADRLEWGTLEEDRDGMLLHANFVAPGFPREELRSWIIEGALQRASENRAAFEPNAWVRAAVARTIAHRGEGSEARRVVLRALWLARHRAASYAVLHRWDRTTERYGAEPIEAAAYTAALALRETGRFEAFARELVAVEPPWGMRAVIEARRDPVPARMERVTGISETELVAAWRDHIARWRADPAFAEIHAVPRARGEISIERGEGDLRTIVWSVAFDPAPEPGSRCTLLHVPLGVFDDVLPLEELQREERPCAELGDERLVGRYSPGQRVFLAIEVSSAILGTPVRVIAERREIR